MKKGLLLNLSLLLTLLPLSAPAQVLGTTPTGEAVDEAREGQVVTAAETLEAEGEKVFRGVFEHPWAVGFHAGLLEYGRFADDDATAFATGVLLDWNISSFLEERQYLYYGATAGLLYSPLSSAGDVDDEFALILPLSLKVGLRPVERLLLAGHFGLNVFYDPDSQGIELRTTDENFAPVMALGADAAYSVGENLALTARADWTFAQLENPVLLTLGFALAI